MNFINNDFFLGAIAALITSYIATRFQLAYTLNRTRMALHSYLINLFRIKLDSYRSQCQDVIEQVEIFATPQGTTYKYDHLPALNPEYLQIYDLTILRKIIQDDIIFQLYINFKSSINYLQVPSPLELFDDFRNKMNLHKESKHENGKIEEFLECPVVVGLKKDLITALMYKSEASMEMDKEIEKIIKYLSGSTIIWFLTYAFYRKKYNESK